jgi:hypothetical protein
MIGRVIAQRWMSGWTALGALATVGIGGVCALAVGGTSTPQHGAAAPRTAGQVRVAMSFEANRGQAPRSVDYLAHGDGFAVGLGRGEVHMALSSAHGRLSHVTLATPGGRLGRPVADSPRTGHVSYLVGDRSRWLRGVPAFAGVRYRSVWPGIDLAFRGSAGALEYDLDVAANADPAAINLALPGATSVRTDGHGGAIVHARGGAKLRLAPPVSFQQDAGGGQTPVASRLVVDRGGHVGVALGDYDRSRALVIDPSVAFSTFGGGHSSIATGVGADASNNVYIAGNAAQGDDLATTSGSLQTSYGGGYDDVFVEKLNPSGTAVQYATYLGSTHEDYAYGLDVDGAGNAYITGTTNAPSGAGAFPTTAGAYQTGYGGGYFDGFVAKLNPSGSGLVYSTLIGGAGQDGSYGIAVGSDGSAAFTGNFPNFHSCTDLATGKLSPSGGALSWFTCTPGAVGHGVAVDANDNVYVGGLAQAAMTTTSGVVQPTLQGAMYANNSFVEKFTPGGALTYRTFLGGGSTASNSGEGIAVDAAGNAYLTGVSTAAPFPTTAGAVQTASPGGNDAYVIKLNPSATQVVYSTLLGGASTDHGYGIAVDGAGHAYVTGEVEQGFPVTGDAAQSYYAGGSGDAFVSELAADGTSLVYSTYLGGNGQDSGHAAAMAPNGNVLVAGGAGGPFPVTVGAANTTANSGAFVAEIGAPVPGGGGGVTTGGGGATTTGGTDPAGTPAPTTTAPGLVLTLTTSHGDTITVSTAAGQEAYAELDRHLLGGLSGDDMARLLANGGFSVQIPLTYPAYPGAYSGSGSASPSGIPGYNGQGVGGGSPVGYDSAKKKVKPVVLFSFKKSFPKLGTYKFKVKLTRAGMKLMRAAVKANKKLKVSVSVAVAAPGHPTVKHTSSVTLKPGKRAKRH